VICEQPNRRWFSPLRNWASASAARIKEDHNMVGDGSVDG
jgi:hypothetical protein